MAELVAVGPLLMPKWIALMGLVAALPTWVAMMSSLAYISRRDDARPGKAKLS